MYPHAVRRALLLLLLLLALGAIAAGCGGDDDGDSDGATPSAQESCEKDNLELVKPPGLTVGTDNPAFPPWFGGGTPKGSTVGDQRPLHRRGLRERGRVRRSPQSSAFTKTDVSWVVVPFNQSFKPGPKDFDFDINQISITPERAKAVDFSEPYYDVNQALVALKGTPITNAKTLADLKDVKFGAQIGTTSYEHINDTIQPSKDAVRLRHEQRRRLGAQGEADRRHRRRPADRLLRHGRAARGQHDRRPVPGRRRAGAVRAGAREGQPATTCVNEALTQR